MNLQQMPKKCAMLCLSVERFITRDLDCDLSGAEVLLSFSGGADSKALFFILLALSSRLQFKLSLAHLDHAMRLESAAEAAAAKKLAEKYNLDFYSQRVDVGKIASERKLGKEEAGRIARMDFLQKLQQDSKNGTRWIATAHQLNDLAEDVLMRLVRGSGWPALGGMKAIDQQSRSIRPLLLTPRVELEEFLTALEQDWINDPMNLDQAFLRNRVRSKMLPLFMQENPSFLESIAGLWQLARLDEVFWDDASDISEKRLQKIGQTEDFKGITAGGKTTKGKQPYWYDSPEQPDCKGNASECTIQPNATGSKKYAGIPRKISHGSISLDLEALRSLYPATRLRVYKKTLERLGSGQPLLNTLMQLDRAVQDKQSGKLLQFPGNKQVLLKPDSLVFSKMPS